MRLNARLTHPFGGLTFEGAPAARISPEQALRRSVMSCLLWEKEFYEDGATIAQRILDLVPQVRPEAVAMIAQDARRVSHLRHVPLFLISALAKVGGPAARPYIAPLIVDVVSRADELAELLAIHAEVNRVSPAAVKRTIPAQMKHGLARAFLKFDEYQLAKYNRDTAVKLRDVLFLCHAKPDTAERADLWKRLAAGELKTPDTWEVALSGGADKKEAFERLIREGKLGYMALLRNLRNMMAAGCDRALVSDAIVARKGGADRVLPFRFVAAARACPELEPAIDTALVAGIAGGPRLPGRTVVLVDVSGSMDAKLSGKSDMTRLDAAAALASVVNASSLDVLTFSGRLVRVPPRRGMAGVDAVRNSQPHGTTELIGAVATVNREVPYDRLIVITDEQAAADNRSLPAPRDGARGYMVNVASAKNGIGYGRWRHIDGWSDGVIRYIAACEAEDGR